MAWMAAPAWTPPPDEPGAWTRSGSGSMHRFGEVAFPARISRSIRWPTVSPMLDAAVGGEEPLPPA